MAGETIQPKAGKLGRLWRHCWSGRRRMHAVFDDAAFARIEAAINEGEGGHRGEIRFAIEAALDLSWILATRTPRDRALQVFSEHAVWDTEENTGVLIYLLWADHAVEIVADRGAHRVMPAARWDEICAAVTRACRSERHVDGVIDAVVAINHELRAALPVGAGDQDELSNRSIRV